jgi:hypothetical protein
MQWGKRGVVYTVHAEYLERRELRQPVQLSSAREAERRWRYNSVESWVLQGRLRRDGAIVEFTVDKSSARAAVTRGPESVKLKNLHC